jgi:DNA polymerase-3 subunit beta
MNVSVARKTLAEALHSVSRGVSGRSTLPILSNVLLEAQGSELRLLASDLEMWIEQRVPVKVLEEGAITVPARVLGELVDRFGEGDVTMQTSDEAMLAVAWSKSSYQIQALPAEEFPAPPRVTNGTKVTLSQASLKEVLRSTIFAASQDETRAVLTGGLLIWEAGELSIIATDMHRLAINKTKADGKGEAIRAVVPARALHEVARALAGEEQAEISAGEAQIRFDIGALAVISRLVEGQFPNYERVVPQSSEQRLVVNREEFHTAIRRAAVMARLEANKVVLRGKEGTLSIQAETADLGRGSEELPVELEGGEVEVAFNAEYLMDALSVMDCESVELGLTGALSPGLLRPVGDTPFIYVVMPMAIL